MEGRKELQEELLIRQEFPEPWTRWGFLKNVSKNRYRLKVMPIKYSSIYVLSVGTVLHTGVTALNKTGIVLVIMERIL